MMIPRWSHGWLLLPLLGLFGSLEAQTLTRWRTVFSNRIDVTDLAQHTHGALFATPRNAFGNGNIAGLDPATGAVLWELNLFTGGGFPVLSPSPEGAYMANGYTGGNGVTFARVDTLGNLLNQRTYPVDAEIQQVRAASGMAVLSGALHTAGQSYAFWVTGIHPGTLTRVWTYQESGSGRFGARLLRRHPSGDILAAGVVNYGQVVVVRLTADSGNVVWRRVLPHNALPQNIYALNGMAVDNAGGVYVVGSAAGSLSRAFLTHLDSTGAVDRDTLFGATYGLGLAVRDTFLYVIHGSSGSVGVTALSPTGGARWTRTFAKDVTISRAAVDAAGNLVAVGTTPFGAPQDVLISLTPQGATRHVGRVLYGDKVTGLAMVGDEIVVVGDGSTGLAGRYRLVPYLTGTGFSWDDGNNGFPNAEGDPLPGDTLRLRFGFQTHGDPISQATFRLRCSGCASMSLLDSVQNRGHLTDGDTFSVAFRGSLSPSSSPFTLTLWMFLNGDSFQVADTLLTPSPESTPAPAYTVLDDQDVHYPERVVYTWLDTLSGGSVSLSDTAVRLPLPQPFVFAGVAYDSVWVGQGGWWGFGDTLVTLSGDPPLSGLPSTTGLVYAARLEGWPATLDTVPSGSLWAVIWSGPGVRAELVLDYGDAARAGDDRFWLQYQTFTDTTAKIGLQIPRSGSQPEGRMLWNGSQAAPALLPPASGRAYTFLPDTTPFLAFQSPGYAWTWSDQNDNRPGSWGDIATLQVPYSTPGRTTGPVRLRLRCEETGTGLCNALHFTGPDTALQIPAVQGYSTPHTLNVPLVLDSTGHPGDTLRFVLTVEAPFSRDTLRHLFVLVQDTIIVPHPESLMVGMGYFGQEAGDSIDLPFPSVGWVELLPDSGGNGLLLQVSGTDDGRGALPLPQPFVFDSAARDTLWVSTNGWAVLGSDPGTDTYIPDSLPGTTIPGVLAPFWTDLIFENYGNGQGIYVQLQDTLMVVQWANVQRYDNTSDTLNFQLQLRPLDSSLVFFYRTPLPESILTFSSVGIENRSEDAAISVEYNGTFHGYAYPLTAHHAVLFRPLRPTAVAEAPVSSPALSLRYLPRSSSLLLVLPADGPVHLVVLDALGRTRLNLRRHLTAGVHRVPLPPLRRGIYFLRLETPDRTLRMKTLMFRR